MDLDVYNAHLEMNALNVPKQIIMNYKKECVSVNLDILDPMKTQVMTLVFVRSRVKHVQLTAWDALQKTHAISAKKALALIKMRDVFLAKKVSTLIKTLISVNLATSDARNA